MKLSGEVLFECMDIAICSLLDNPELVQACLDVEEDRLKTIFKTLVDVRYPEDSESLILDLEIKLEDPRVEKIYDEEFKDRD